MSNKQLPRRPVVLIILDGVGVNPGKYNNAFAAADTPNLDRYFAHYPHTLLQASGEAVGLPDGQMGNSEVGHMILGCGAVIQQDTVKIDNAIHKGTFYKNTALLAAVHKAKQSNRPLHLLGLVSDGGVHSSLFHLQALLHLCKQNHVKPLLHMITDGRDTAPKSALQYLNTIKQDLYAAGGAVATVSGRYYAMDRDHRWERTELAWRAIVHGKGQYSVDPESAIKGAYAAGDTDEFIRPIVLPMHKNLEANDQLICFNFRKDRPRQIVAALGCENFTGFDRGMYPKITLTCMLPYDKSFELPYAFQPEKPLITLGKVISDGGYHQFHCAETEKYPHVTYFFNGGRQMPYSNETQLLIPSPKVATYDQKPEMSAHEVANAVIDAIQKEKYAFIVVNFANGDMVGHTAIFDAIVKAVETVDKEVGRILDVAVAHDNSVLLTADHGNCEEVIDPNTDAPHTQHTLYPVPCMVIDEISWSLACNAGLASVAPTVLQLMGLDIPAQMTAKSILLKPVSTDIYTRPYHSAA